MTIVLITAGFAAALALLLGLALGFFKEFFRVPEDPLKGKIRDVLPGANCGGCGFPGCDGYAAAVAEGGDITRCTAGGKAVADQLAAIMGVAAAEITAMVPVCCCLGGEGVGIPRGIYNGLKTCRGAKLTGGTKLCSWGCIGFGDCVQVCRFGALSMGKDGLPRVDRAKCTGCKVCVTECPQGVLKVVPRDKQITLALCSNRSPIRSAIRKTCRVGCIKCGICVKNCPEQCIALEDGIPVVNYEKCSACGTCEQKCPTKIMRVFGKAPAVS
ncbi:MAG: RnfABCDGE type electron transport complex subunit B [Treponema sp.]|jgi:Na+-translocating ferredoxin:NAD+ oxidoreductase RNF subunit RnfB|nr:RnfABCDGE type electron transport complex subunit B [Treponema sp.]